MAHTRTFWADFKQFFWRGLGVLLPTVLTLWLLVQAYGFVQRQVAEPINSGVRGGILYLMPRYVGESRQPDWYRVDAEEVQAYRAQNTVNKNLTDDEVRARLQTEGLLAYWNARWYLRAIGLAVAILAIYLAGLLLSGFIGRQLYEGLERLIGRVPIVKAVYPHVKQLVDLILGEKSMAFKKVVLVQYPRQGIWTVGFLAGEGLSWANQASGEDTVSVYIPSTPTPFTGFTITMRKSDVLEISMTVDEAVRFVLTGGILIPPDETDADPAVDPPPPPLPPLPGLGRADGPEAGETRVTAPGRPKTAESASTTPATRTMKSVGRPRASSPPSASALPSPSPPVEPPPASA